MGRRLRCKECIYWYGGEDFGFGPCQIKLQRSDRAYVTFGQQLCDEETVWRSLE